MTIREMTTGQFEILISQIKRLGKLTNGAIQRAAVFSVFQSIEHRNATPADTLLKAMPQGTRRQSLVEYFEKYGNLAYLATEKKMAFFDVAEMTGKPAQEYDEDRLLAAKWFSMSPEPDITSAWDVREQLDKLLTRLEKAVDNDTREVLNKDLIRKVRHMMAEGSIEAPAQMPELPALQEAA